MTIARDIVKLMGGDLRLASELGKGSLFYFDVTFQRVFAPEAATDVVAENQPPVLRDKRVFVVDDHETNLMLVKELLEQDGHQVTTATSGFEALQILGTHTFDVALLDYNLGDMDGVKLLQLYRFGKGNTAPAYFLTADATLITAEKLQNSGASGVLTKPVSLADLRGAVSSACLGKDVSAAMEQELPPLVKPSPAPQMDAIKSRPILKAVPSQPLDLSVIDHLRSISGRPAFLRELLVHANEDIRRNSDDLIKALATHELDLVKDMAHALKGVCASIGAIRLMGLANNLMRMSRDELRRNGTKLRTEITETTQATTLGIQGVLDDLGDNDAGRSAASLHLN